MQTSTKDSLKPQLRTRLARLLRQVVPPRRRDAGVGARNQWQCHQGDGALAQ